MKISYKNKKRINKFLIACFVFVTVFYMSPISVFADTYYIEADFYRYSYGSNLETSHSVLVSSLHEPDLDLLFYNGVYNDICEVLTEANQSNFIDSDDDLFISVDDIFSTYDIRSCISDWYEYTGGSLSYQLIKYNCDDSFHSYRLIFYFLDSLHSDGIQILDSNRYLLSVPSFTLLSNSAYIFPYGARIAVSYSASTGSFVSYPFTFSHSDYVTSGTTGFSYTYNDLSNYRFSYSVNPLNSLSLNLPDFKDNSNHIIVLDFYLGDYSTQFTYNLGMSFVNSFPHYSLNSSETFYNSEYEIVDIISGSFGPVIRLDSGIAIQRVGNQYYMFTNAPNSTVFYTLDDYILPAFVTVTPTPSPSVSPEPTVTYPAQYTQIPYPTQEPYYTQIPYPTQEPYYTQIPYPTQEPYYTQMPYPTQIPYYTQIPYPSGLNNLGELTDALLTPMASPTGMPDFGFDFGLDDVSSDLSLSTSLTGSSASNFFLALISILWDKGNLVFYGFFTVALGLIFIAYLLGHSRRG